MACEVPQPGSNPALGSEVMESQPLTASGWLPRMGLCWRSSEKFTGDVARPPLLCPGCGLYQPLSLPGAGLESLWAPVRVADNPRGASALKSRGPLPLNKTLFLAEYFSSPHIGHQFNSWLAVQIARWSYRKQRGRGGKAQEALGLSHPCALSSSFTLWTMSREAGPVAAGVRSGELSSALFALWVYRLLSQNFC